MQHNFILTDTMKTGYHVQFEQFINMNTLTDQSFETTGEYYTLHNYDLDSYDRRFAIIDTRQSNERVNSPEFNAELLEADKFTSFQGQPDVNTGPGRFGDDEPLLFEP